MTILDRRAFIQFLAAATAAPAAGCGGSNPRLPPPPSAAVGAGGPLAIFEVLEEIRAELRRSPGHLPARAAALVEAKDAKALFEFVRDRIATLPRSHFGVFGYRGDLDMPWGVRGTLRAGAGTPREKAELLTDLYRRAGLSAEVVEGDYGSGSEPWRDHFAGKAPPYADITITPDKISRWRRALGTPGSPVPPPPVDPSGTESAALAKRVLTALGDTKPPKATGFRWAGPTPLVRVTVDGNAVHANPHRPSAEFGNPYCAPKSIRPARPAAPPTEVRLSLYARDSHKLAQDRELVTLKANTHQLSGRQAVIKAMPLMPLRDLAVTRLDAIDAYTPSITVQKLDDLEGAPLGASGSTIALSGDVYRLDGDDVLVNGVRLKATDPSLRPRVKTLQVKAHANQFPDVRLQIQALDAAGKPVEGLVASDFVVTEGGTKQRVWLKSNSSQPRIVGLIDSSMSMPKEFYGEPAKKLAAELQAAIKEKHPGALVSIQFTGSELWSELAKAMAGDPTLVFYITDGDVVGNEAAFGASLRGGTPAILLSVRDRQRKVLQRMAELTGGQVVAATAPEEAKRAVLDALAKHPAPPYQLMYRASSTGGASRTVSVQVRETQAKASAKYKVETKLLGPRRLISLILEVQIGHHKVRRVVAGFDPRTGRSSMSPADVTRYASQVRDALNGTHVISFEGLPPPAAVLLDDYFSSKLSYRDLVASSKAPTETIEKLLERGVIYLPPAFVGMNLRHPSWRDAKSITYPTGLHAVVFSEIPMADSAKTKRSIDLLGLDHTRTASEDDATAFRLNAERTAFQSVAEAKLRTTSTAATLKGATLVPFDSKVGQKAVATSEPNRRNRWREFHRESGGNPMLIASDAKTFSHWRVDRRTGALLGIMPNGSGGAETLAALDVQLAYLKVLAQAVGASPALGAVAGYHQKLARLYAAVTVAIDTMSAALLEKELQGAVGSMACGIIADLMLPAIAGSLKDLIGSLTNVPC